MRRRPNRARGARVALDATRDRRRTVSIAQHSETPTARRDRLTALRATLAHA